MTFQIILDSLPPLIIGALFGLLLIFGPRLENSMDDALLGRRVANHKIKGWTIAGLICVGIGFVFFVLILIAKITA